MDTHGRDYGDEDVDVEQPEAPAVVYFVYAPLDDSEREYGWVEAAGKQDTQRYINADALLRWLLSRTGNEQIRLQCLAAHVLVERFLEEHSLRPMVDES